MLSPEYVAGLFDGEGCIGLYQTKGSVDARYVLGRRGPAWVRIVAITGAYLPTIEALKHDFGGRIARRNKTNKQVYEWIIGSKEDIGYFLNYVLPHLREKRAQAALMLEALENRDEETAAPLLRAMKKESYD